MATEMANSTILEKILSGAQVPALPQSAIRLLELWRDPDNGPVEFAVPVESDPGLASQVLRFVNSSYFGFAREIPTVRTAISMVGMRTIKNFALWSAVFSSISDPKCGPYDLKQAWRDSLRRAIFARAVAASLHVDQPEETFTAALLQDVAVPLLARVAPQTYASMLVERRVTGTRLSELERRNLGWTHAKAGGMICRRWNLPESLAQMVEGHIEIDRSVDAAEKDPATAAVALSALLPTSVDPDWEECELLATHCRSVIPSNLPGLLEIFQQVDLEFTELASVLRVPAAGQTLAECYKDVAAVAC